MSIFIDHCLSVNQNCSVWERTVARKSRGRPTLSDIAKAFRSEVAEQFLQVVHRRNLTRSQAAYELGVTRQAFHKYVRGESTPQAAVLARACTLWDLRLNYAGAEFGKGAFAAPESKAAADPELLQMNLFDRPQIFENDQLIVVLERAHKSILQVTIKMKRASLPQKPRGSRKVS